MSVGFPRAQLAVVPFVINQESLGWSYELLFVIRIRLEKGLLRSQRFSISSILLYYLSQLNAILSFRSFHVFFFSTSVVSFLAPLTFQSLVNFQDS